MTNILSLVSVSTVLAGVYVAVMLFFLGFFLGDRMSFKNPRYGEVIVVAVFWPFFIALAIYNRVIQG